MNQAEVDSTVLDIVGKPPAGENHYLCHRNYNNLKSSFPAPIGFSFACNGTFLFRKDTTSLLLTSIQVQPKLAGVNKFSRAYDCVGFFSGAILSGIFVTFILGTVLAIGITCILDIKTPNKFESRSSKQLTFTVQE